MVDIIFFIIYIYIYVLVHTTAHSLGYGVTEGHGFTYRERLGGMNGKFPQFAKSLSKFMLGSIIVSPIMIPMLAVFPDYFVNQIKMYMNSDPGKHKAKAFNKLFNGFQPNGLTSVTALASSSSNHSQVNVHFSSNYDAGLGFSALSAVTVAGTILEHRHKGASGNGFETAVTALTPNELKQSFKRVGVEIQTNIQIK